MQDDQEALTRLAEAVADHKPVDWKLQNDTPEGMKRQLQLIEALGALHQAPASTGPQESDTGIGRLHTELSDGDDGPPRAWGHLRDLEPIGRGGFGEVYRAYDPQLDRHVALKLLRPELSGDELNCRRFIQEARRQASIRHPNVLVVHGADRHDGRVGLWMDLVKGQTLEQRLQQQGVFGPEEAALIGIEICRALAAMHNAGLIHQDVKTSNAMRQEGGQIVLMDFSAVSDRTAETKSSRRESISGTPLFMAPEVLDGEQAGVSSDIYSLGVLLFRLVTKAFPVEARRLSRLREKHRHGECTLLRDARADLPVAFVQAVDKALALTATERHASVGEMERALAASLGSVSQPQGETRKVPVWTFRRVSQVAALVLLAAALWAFWPRDLWVESAFSRLRAGVEEPLGDGGQVQPGDALLLDIEGSAAFYLYIFNEDQHGDVFVLFPMEGLDSRNPFAAKAVHRLPGTISGGLFHWEVTSVGERETIMVVASRKRLSDLEQRIQGIPTAQEGRPVEIPGRELAPLLRGIGGLKPAAPGKSVQGLPLSAEFSGLAAHAARTSGLWVRRMELTNPGNREHVGEMDRGGETDADQSGAITPSN